MGVVVRVVKTPPEVATAGSGGRSCQIAGAALTVGAIASATGGIRPGALIERDNKG